MNLGRLEEVDLRKQWNDEARDFTPWLAQDDNIQLLGETIGMELEVEQEEMQVGPFRADILCRETTTDKFVIIENQLEKTNHRHLGQIITYAAGLDASAVIWIARNFQEEHRAAIDWLNRVSDDSIHFFGIELQLYKIGNSPAAPMFKVLAKPNDWTKFVRSGKKGELNDTQELRLEYWQKFKEYAEQHKCTLKLRAPSASHWTDISIGTSGFHLSCHIVMQKKIIRVMHVLSTKASARFYDKYKQLYEEESYKALGKEIEWVNNPDVGSSCVQLEREADAADKNDWEEQFAWLLDKLEMFNAFFAPKAKKIKAEARNDRSTRK